MVVNVVDAQAQHGRAQPALDPQAGIDVEVVSVGQLEVVDVAEGVELLCHSAVFEASVVHQVFFYRFANQRNRTAFRR